jgi:hypothetical protein
MGRVSVEMSDVAVRRDAAADAAFHELALKPGIRRAPVTGRVLRVRVFGDTFHHVGRGAK